MQVAGPAGPAVQLVRKANTRVVKIHGPEKPKTLLSGWAVSHGTSDFQMMTLTTCSKKTPKQTPQMCGSFSSGILAGFSLCSCVCVKALQASLLYLSLRRENSSQIALHCQSCLCSVLPVQTGGAATKQHFFTSKFPGKQKEQVQNTSQTSLCRKLVSYVEVVCLKFWSVFWRLLLCPSLSKSGQGGEPAERLQHPCAALQL